MSGNTPINQDDANFNEKRWNNYFSPEPGVPAKQVSGPDLDLVGAFQGDTPIKGLLVRKELGEQPRDASLTRNVVKRRSVIDRIIYEDLFYSIRKMIRYLQMHENNMLTPRGSFFISKISDSRDEAIRSRPIDNRFLGDLYDSQLELLGGGNAPTSDRFFGDTQGPLPNAIGKDEFIARLQPRAAQANVTAELERMGIQDTLQSNIPEVVEVSQFVPPTISDQTPLERSCLGSAVRGSL